VKQIYDCRTKCSPTDEILIHIWELGKEIFEKYESIEKRNPIQFTKKVILGGVSLIYWIPWQFYILSYLLKFPMSRSYKCGKYSTVSEPKRSFSMTNPLPTLMEDYLNFKP